MSTLRKYLQFCDEIARGCLAHQLLRIDTLGTYRNPPFIQNRLEGLRETPARH